MVDYKAMSSKHKQCLLLNADYSAIGIINWQKAITLIYKYQHLNNKIEVLSYYNDDNITCISSTIPNPAIIRLMKYFAFNKLPINFSRKNLFIRDNFTCQYCGVAYPIHKLTYDHIIPKSRWDHRSSPTSWHNVVTACYTCNAKKANRTPIQANMPLLNTPHIPKNHYKYLPIHTELHTIRHNVPETWKPYL